MKHIPEKRAARRLCDIGEHTEASGSGTTTQWSSYTVFSDDDRREFLYRCITLMSNGIPGSHVNQIYYKDLLKAEGLDTCAK